MAAESAAAVPPPLPSVNQVLLVLSGKGGVGKSTVACQLAMALAAQGKRVGILDVDICGPSVPKICGVENANVTQGAKGWEPVVATHLTPTPADGAASGDAPVGQLRVMSIAFLLASPTDAVVWRGPRKDAMIKQFVSDVNWGPLDALVVDTPPGTSDEHLTLCESLRGRAPGSVGAVVVTTPQNVATDDVKKELNFCVKLKLPCLGLVENMSGYVCPHCAECTAIFGRGGGEALAKAAQVPFLGRVPIDPTISLLQDLGKRVAAARNGGDGDADAPADGQTLRSPAADAIAAVVARIAEEAAAVASANATA